MEHKNLFLSVPHCHFVFSWTVLVSLFPLLFAIVRLFVSMSFCWFVCCFSSFHLYKCTQTKSLSLSLFHIHPLTWKMFFQCLSSQIFHWHHMPPLKNSIVVERSSFLHRIIILFIWFLFRIYCYWMFWWLIFSLLYALNFTLNFQKCNMLFSFVFPFRWNEY